MIKVAVIGTGVMGQFHLRNYNQMKGVKIVGVCDVNPVTGKEVASKYNTQYYKDHKSLIKDAKPDAASITVPTKYHHEVAIDFIENHIPVLIEKPIAVTTRQAKNIASRAQRNNVTVLIGHVERFNPVVIKMHSLLKEGVFGDILAVVVKRVGLFPPRIKDVNVVTDLAVHDLDIITSLLGGNLPVSVSARGGSGLANGRTDHAEIFLQYPIFGCFLQVNWVTPIKIRTLSITGTKGYAELNYITQKIELYKSNYKITQPLSFEEFTIEFGEPEKIEIDVSGTEPLRSELENFINSVEGKEKPVVTIEDGIRALMLSEKVIASIKKAYR